ncbi:MAG: hypothetical protein WAK11_13880 [Candidatus Cybelea sp.]
MAVNAPALYTARMEESVNIAEDVAYERLSTGILEFTVRAAIARTEDESEWEHEELRRRGLSSIQIFRNGKAIWTDRDIFEAELAEARRSKCEGHFAERNELDATFLEELDRNLRHRWRLAGYEVPSLLRSMKVLFSELESDVRDRIADARQALTDEILASACPDLYEVRSVSEGDSPNISR